MRKTLLAAAVAATLATAAVDASAASGGAVTKSDLQAMQAQMQALADRLTRLEASNTQLQTENQQLRATVEQRDAEVDYLKAQTKDLRQEAAQSEADLAKVKGADWASRIKFKGDVRVREEYIGKQYVAGKAPTTTTASTLSVEDAQDQWRTRYRVRFGAEAQVTDHAKVVLRLASGDGDPRSTNQTMTNESSGKGIWIDQAYADWNFMSGGDLILGKQPLPFWRPEASFFWDRDVMPEAVAVTLDRGVFFGSGYAWMVQENFNNNSSYVNVDPTIFGAQAGLKFPLLGGETRVAATYYDLANGKGNAPFYNGNAFNNTTYKRYLNGCAPSTVPSCATNVLQYDYSVFQLSGELGTMVGNLPLTLMAEWAENTASDVEYGTAWALGASIGKAANYHTWEASVLYQSIEKDALFAQFIDSDNAGGITDASGWVFKAAYAPVKNVTVNATYYLNTLFEDVPAISGTVPGTGPYAGPYSEGRNLDYNRLQLDVNYKF